MVGLIEAKLVGGPKDGEVYKARLQLPARLYFQKVISEEFNGNGYPVGVKYKTYSYDLGYRDEGDAVVGYYRYNHEV